MRGSIGGVTVGNAWMRNNPCLQYPEGHENMDEDTLADALKVDSPIDKRNLVRCDFIAPQEQELQAHRSTFEGLVLNNRLDDPKLGGIGTSKDIDGEVYYNDNRLNLAFICWCAAKGYSINGVNPHAVNRDEN